MDHDGRQEKPISHPPADPVPTAKMSGDIIVDENRFAVFIFKKDWRKTEAMWEKLPEEC